MNAKKTIALIFIALSLIAPAALAAQATEAQGAQQAQAGAQAAAPAAQAKAPTDAWKYIAAAIAVGAACIGGGLAVGQVGAAAMGAMSENAELSGKAIPFAGLAEGICLWGFLIAILIILL
jgi:V/A-type H+-transporting ATPase subunit K